MEVELLRSFVATIVILTWIGGLFFAYQEPNLKKYTIGHFVVGGAIILLAPLLLGILAGGG